MLCCLKFLIKCFILRIMHSYFMAYVCEMMLYGIGILFAFLLAGCSVDPYAINIVIAFSKAFLVKICLVVIPLRINSTTAAPDLIA